MRILFYSETKITLFYLLSFAFIRFHLLHHSSSFVVILYHLLYHSLSLVVIRCHSLYLSLSLVVIRYTIRCHSLCHSLPPVFTRCTTCLFFYKRSCAYTVWIINCVLWTNHNPKAPFGVSLQISTKIVFLVRFSTQFTVSFEL